MDIVIRFLLQGRLTHDRCLDIHHAFCNLSCLKCRMLLLDLEDSFNFGLAIDRSIRGPGCRYIDGKREPQSDPSQYQPKIPKQRQSSSEEFRGHSRGSGALDKK